MIAILSVSGSAWGPLWAGALAAAGTALAAPALARLAPRLGLVDAASGEVVMRKLQVRPVPSVGGVAVLFGLLAGAALTLRSGLHGGGAPLSWGGPLVAALPWMPGPIALALALVLAFGVGLLDDLVPGGLRPMAKLLGQVIAGMAPAVPLLLYQPGAQALLYAAILCALAVVAMNAVNTFDNTDGGAGLLGAAALAGPLPLAAGALLGFLPFNLDADRRVRRSAPTCYLGDSGSHLVGMLIALTPVAWPSLSLPLLDLGRLAVARVSAGQAPWIGDRRHLAHRLEEAGLSRAGVLGVLALVAFPSVLVGGWGMLAGSGAVVALGVGATALAFAAVSRGVSGTRSSPP